MRDNQAFKQTNKKITSFTFSSYQLWNCLPYSGQKHFSKGRSGIGKNTLLYFYLCLICHFTTGSCFTVLALLEPIWVSIFSSIKWRSWIKKISLILCPSWVLHFLFQQYFLFIAPCSLVFLESLFGLIVFLTWKDYC